METNNSNLHHDNSLVSTLTLCPFCYELRFLPKQNSPLSCALAAHFLVWVFHFVFPPSHKIYTASMPVSMETSAASSITCASPTCLPVECSRRTRTFVSHTLPSLPVKTSWLERSLGKTLCLFFFCCPSCLMLLRIPGWCIEPDRCWSLDINIDIWELNKNDDDDMLVFLLNMLIGWYVP